MRTVIFTLVLILMPSAFALAKVQTQAISYQHGEVQLEGILAWDDSITGKRPGILVVHEWWGLNDYARDRARQLAQLGYVAFAADMYGKDKITVHPDQAGAWMKQVQANVSQWQARAIKGLAVLRSQEQVDPKNIAAIGYCFGGATVIQLAYSGEEIKGAVSFHGALPLPIGKQATKVKTKILIAHGNADPFQKEDHIRKFRNALDKANVDWQMVFYAGARHSFTDPGADARGMDALKYDQAADVRSWKHMQLFFDEIFLTP
ncbi:dienelactone hydrolase family protein [Candidatus Nitronereus thalassa]|uniref:Dienelactone hydrolase family protein n=1 Tax=Candidatus Nitronereus thalassa TaxID=3020898 RepID=A0ABU3K976_9BACT|nr:dienelactone hydrolase family protein [Candidatus Nitronereus thalassa]MDT7042936.1 dienelactone hydrolase family protein [Candidatus Nitronereus thalassa]